MKPVAVFRHVAHEGPGYLADYLDEHSVPWELIRIDAGDTVPADTTQYSGLVFMGGPMSVNDDLPWITAELGLIRDAVAQNIPVMGHCLGGQLMSKALGATITKNPVKEIGWGNVTVLDNDTARAWFGNSQKFEAFHWHGETFSLPQGATHLLSSAHCPNQAWSLGKHLAMQCHIEMTEKMIHSWCEKGAHELAACADSPGVQTAEAMQKQMCDKLPQLHNAARQAYRKWTEGLPSFA